MSDHLGNYSKKVCIGDKVLLEHSMKGEVAYIGPVAGKQGVYYGIVLTEPKGKNDGCVHKRRYFDCQEDYGLFIHRGRIQKSKAAINERFKNLPRVVVGDRVLIKSKKLYGIIRFIGSTESEPEHILYGIELEKAEGDNHGELDNRVYFACKQKHGVFASGHEILPTLIDTKKKKLSGHSSKNAKNHANSKRQSLQMPTTPLSPMVNGDGLAKKAFPRKRASEKTKKRASVTVAKRNSSNPSFVASASANALHSVSSSNGKQTNGHSSTPRKSIKASTPKKTESTSSPIAKSKVSSPRKKHSGKANKAKSPKQAPTTSSSPRKKLISMHNRYPSFVVKERYQTETHRERSLLLVHGYCHVIEQEDLTEFFDTYYWTDNEWEFEEKPNRRTIPMSILDLCHSFLYEKINVDDFNQLTLIGKGGFAEVRLVTYKHNDDVKHYYAMKSLSKKLMLKKKQENQIFIERDILITLNHWLIIRLFWSFQDTKYLHLVEEFCEGGDLMKILMQYEILTHEATQFYVAEIAEVINYLHEHGYIHRDIKPDNVLIHRSGHIKLCDFGSAAVYVPEMATGHDVVPRKSRKNKKLLYRIVGTPDYVAPEVISKKGYGFECDFWSLGVIMFECLCGYPPFYAGSPKQTCRNILQYSKKFHIPADAQVDTHAADCMHKLICSWQSRMKYKRIQKHAFFRNIDWDNLYNMQPPHSLSRQQADAGDGDDSENELDIGMLFGIAEDQDETRLHYTNTAGSIGMGSVGALTSGADDVAATQGLQTY